MCPPRFANEVSPIAAAHVDADVMAVMGADDQVMTSTVVEPIQAADDFVAATATNSDIVMDEQQTDEGKEALDASATRNQRQLLIFTTAAVLWSCALYGLAGRNAPSIYLLMLALYKLFACLFNFPVHFLFLVIIFPYLFISLSIFFLENRPISFAA